nr:DUF5054 domain-containing protein [Paenibacillus protaetiae]
MKKWLPDFRNYGKSDFQAARLKDEVDVSDIPAKYGYIGAFALDEFDRHHSRGQFAAAEHRRSYSMLESSWAEQRAYTERAILGLSKDKQAEAQQAFQALQPVKANTEGAAAARIREVYRSGSYAFAFGDNGSLVHLTDENGKSWCDEHRPFGAFVYETFGTEDYAGYFRTYMQNLPVTHPWADADFGKPGFEYVRPLPSHGVFVPTVDDVRFRAGASADEYRLRLRMPVEAYEQYGAPRELEIAYDWRHADGIIDIALQWFGKDASRLPEASWFSCGLKVDSPNLWMMDKLGSPISPLQVVKGGNRNLHAVGRGISYAGADGSAMLETMDAALAAPGRRRLLQFDHTFSPLEQGWHFNLHNNIWGTNFPMWYEEDAKFRFRLRLKSNGK